MRLQISDLLRRAGTRRTDEGVVAVDIDLPQATVAGDAVVAVELKSISGGVRVTGGARVTAHLSCTRCLLEWDEEVEVELDQVYGADPGESDSSILPGGWIDLTELVQDEVSLGMPGRPVCKPECRGLCPTCGSDLNTSPCAGHGDESRSPLAALKQLLEP